MTDALTRRMCDGLAGGETGAPPRGGFVPLNAWQVRWPQRKFQTRYWIGS
jgi:hypothetical protein